MSLQVAARNYFLQIERPGGPLGTGVIWRMCLPHGHPWRRHSIQARYIHEGASLYIISASLDRTWAPSPRQWMCSRHPKRRSHFKDCLKEGDWAWWWILRFWSVCTCKIWSSVGVIVVVVVIIVDQDRLRRLGWIQMSLTATQLSSIFYFKRRWNSFKSLFHNAVLGGYAISIILCCVDSLSLSLHLLPHSAPKDNPF